MCEKPGTLRNRSPLVALLLVPFVLVMVIGCARPAPPPPQPLPPGGEWEGVYQGSDLIYLRIQRRGNVALGQWRAQGDREGTLRGEIKGNQLDYTWWEQSVKADNKNSASGRGVLYYRVTPKGDEIIGKEWRGPRGWQRLRLAKKRTDVAADTPEDELMDSTTTYEEDDECLDCYEDDEE